MKACAVTTWSIGCRFSCAHFGKGSKRRDCTSFTPKTATTTSSVDTSNRFDPQIPANASGNVEGIGRPGLRAQGRTSSSCRSQRQENAGNSSIIDTARSAQLRRSVELDCRSERLTVERAFGLRTLPSTQVEANSLGEAIRPHIRTCIYVKGAVDLPTPNG